MHTEMIVRDSVSRQIDAVLHDATIAMTRSLAGVPEEVRYPLYDVRRGRRAHLMGQYPRVACVIAGFRAPLADVFGPMFSLHDHILTTYYQTSFCMREAISRETEAGHIQNVDTHRVIRNPDEAALEAYVDSCNVQIAETQLAKAVALRELHQLRAR